MALVCSKRFLEANRLTASARLLSMVSFSGSPDKVFASGVPAIKEALERCSLTPDDIDIFEVSESFAAQAIYTRNKMKIPGFKMNVWGGDVALGHPLGAAGTRILVTLLHILKDRNKKRGLCCVSFGGGGSVAMVIERG